MKPLPCDGIGSVMHSRPWTRCPSACTCGTGSGMPASWDGLVSPTPTFPPGVSGSAPPRLYRDGTHPPRCILACARRWRHGALCPWCVGTARAPSSQPGAPREPSRTAGRVGGPCLSDPGRAPPAEGTQRDQRCPAFVDLVSRPESSAGLQSSQVHPQRRTREGGRPVHWTVRVTARRTPRRVSPSHPRRAPSPPLPAAVYERQPASAPTPPFLPVARGARREARTSAQTP